MLRFYILHLFSCAVAFEDFFYKRKILPRFVHEARIKGFTKATKSLIFNLQNTLHIHGKFWYAAPWDIISVPKAANFLPMNWRLKVNCKKNWAGLPTAGQASSIFTIDNCRKRKFLNWLEHDPAHNQTRAQSYTTRRCTVAFWLSIEGFYSKVAELYFF